jgi:hypothetical protein
MPGAIIILFVMFIAGPISIFVIGLVLSAATGWLLTADADDRANAPATDSAAT